MPAYKRIGVELRVRLETRQWLPGAMLPSRKELAAEYGVSVPTIERAVADLLTEGALRADHRGTFVTGQHHDLGMHPRRSAATATVGIVAGLRHSENEMESAKNWTETITKAVERSFSQTGTMTRFFNLHRPDGTTVTHARAREALLADGVDAIIDVLPTAEEIMQISISARIPFVFITGFRYSHPLLSVCYDNQDAGYQAAHHLLEQGCPDLLYFAPYSADWVESRLAGVRQAAQMAGLPAEAVQSWISPTPLAEFNSPLGMHQELAYAAARRLLVDGLSAQGVIAANDMVALGFRQAAQEVGLEAGRDYALVGFDDGPLAREAGLTSLHPPVENLGQEAVRLLLSALDGHTTRPQVCLRSHLVPRASSRMLFSYDQVAPIFARLQTSHATNYERDTHHDTAIL